MYDVESYNAEARLLETHLRSLAPDAGITVLRFAEPTTLTPEECLEKMQVFQVRSTRTAELSLSYGCARYRHMLELVVRELARQLEV